MNHFSEGNLNDFNFIDASCEFMAVKFQIYFAYSKYDFNLSTF